MDRDELHRIIDTLPEGSLEHVQRMLKRLQTWPPQPPPEIEKIRQQFRERVRQGVRPGGGFAGRGGGAYTRDESGRVRKGHWAFSYPEDELAVRQTHHFHEGFEVTVTERMRLGENGKTLMYKNEISGPDGRTHTQDLTFGIDGGEWGAI